MTSREAMLFMKYEHFGKCKGSFKDSQRKCKYLSIHIYEYSMLYSPFLLPFRLPSREKAKSMFVKGWLIVFDKTGLTTLSVIICKVTHGDI